MSSAVQRAAGEGPVVSLTGIGVHFRLPTDRITSFKEYVLRRLMSGIQYHDLWALQDVSLDIHRGQVLGVIGRNGAGKSSLLKVVSRVLQPTLGRVVIRGRVAPLLELGAGFHPDLTGRENITMNGTLLGYPRATIRESLEEVVAWAELQEFIDSPLRTYSSGMAARLGFAVATQYRPDILVLDEVLAVGDLSFQEKCIERIEDFTTRGSTIILVSHSPATIQAHCDQAAWLEHGRLAAVGDPSAVIAKYAQSLALESPPE